MNEKDTDKIENYLAEVTKRLFDTEMALRSTLIFCRTRKEMLISTGKTHDYDQGRIDTAVEVLRYASGEENLDDIVTLIKEEQKRAKIEKEALGIQIPGMESV